MYNSTRERIEKDVAALRQAWTSLAAIDPRPAPPGRHPSANSAGSDVVIPGIHDSEDVLTIVVLGATGDLAKKLTFPALFALFTAKFIPERFHIVGVRKSP